MLVETGFAVEVKGIDHGLDTNAHHCGETANTEPMKMWRIRYENWKISPGQMSLAQYRRIILLCDRWQTALLSAICGMWRLHSTPDVRRNDGFTRVAQAPISSGRKRVWQRDYQPGIAI